MTTPKAAKELVNLAGQIRELAKQAGEEILHFYRKGVVVTRKEDASPLTLADRASRDFSRYHCDLGRVSRSGEAPAGGDGEILAGGSSGWDKGIYQRNKRVHCEYRFD